MLNGMGHEVHRSLALSLLEEIHQEGPVFLWVQRELKAWVDVLPWDVGIQSVLGLLVSLELHEQLVERELDILHRIVIGDRVGFRVAFVVWSRLGGLCRCRRGHWGGGRWGGQTQSLDAQAKCSSGRWQQAVLGMLLTLPGAARWSTGLPTGRR